MFSKFFTNDSHSIAEAHEEVDGKESKTLTHDELLYDDSAEYSDITSTSNDNQKKNFFDKLVDFANGLNAETKGIEPVTDEEKTNTSVFNTALLWFSANLVLASYALGALGPIAFGLNFGVSILTIVFFNLLGIVTVSYFSVFGAELGLRQMVLSRFLVGNLPARFFALVNSIACVGWAVLNTVAAGQLLHMVNRHGHNIPVWAGCLVIMGGTVLVSFFGYRFIHLYEKWSWVPNFAVFLVIIARLKKSHEFKDTPWTSGSTTAGSVLSFGSVLYGFAAGWTTYASDYTVYMPRNTNKYKIFFYLTAGLAFPLIFTQILGAASGLAGLNNPEWLALYKKNNIGGLTYAILVPNSLHGFGEFCCVVLAMSTIAINIPNMYTIGLSVQAFWEPLAKIPRIVWTICGSCAVVGICVPAYYYFIGFMENFMDSIGYYLAIYIAIALSEHFFYRRGFKNYNVEDWDKFDKLPIGIAGLIAIFIAGFGVALGMSQTYWTGEISRKIGKEGGDIGFEMGFGWAFVAYNVFRPLELKYFGR